MFDIHNKYAPDFKDIAHWINSDPLTIAGLKGKVVLIDFWTYSCINCVRTQPYINAWYDKYKDDGLVIVGIHAPEFEFEKRLENVQRAVLDEKIGYPVALDNSYGTWNAYDNHYWPAKYLVDQGGKIQFTHFGEGAYDETEREIQKLLQKSDDLVAVKGTIAAWQSDQTSETYLGYERGRNFLNQIEFRADVPVRYTLVSDTTNGTWSLGGIWTVGPAGSTTEENDCVLRIRFSAKEVYLVMDGPKNAAARLTLDGKAVTAGIGGGADVAAGGRVPFDGARLYKLIKLPVFTQNVALDVTLPKGVTVHAFTFGG